MKHIGWYFENKFWKGDEQPNQNVDWQAAYTSDNLRVPQEFGFEPIGWMLPDFPGENCRTGVIDQPVLRNELPSKNATPLFRKIDQPAEATTPPEELQEQLILCREMCERLNAKIIEQTTAITALVGMFEMFSGSYSQRLDAVGQGLKAVADRVGDFETNVASLRKVYGEPVNIELVDDFEERTAIQIIAAMVGAGGYPMNSGTRSNNIHSAWTIAAEMVKFRSAYRKPD